MSVALIEVNPALVPLRVLAGTNVPRCVTLWICVAENIATYRAGLIVLCMAYARRRRALSSQIETSVGTLCRRQHAALPGIRKTLICVSDPRAYES